MQKRSKVSLNRSARPFSAALVMTLAILCISCYRYHALRVEYRASPARLFVPDAGRQDANGGLEGASLRATDIIKYLAVPRPTSPAAIINKKGVELALGGRFNEARNLFLEALREDANMAAAYNNLGIVYEVFGRTDESTAMYSKARLLEPGNARFRQNFVGQGAGRDGF